MSERCESCKFWRAEEVDEWDLFVDEDEDYKPIYAPGKWGRCRRGAEFRPTLTAKFFVMDGSQYRADLNTRNDFGCVEYEAQDDN